MRFHKLVEEQESRLLVEGKLDANLEPMVDEAAFLQSEAAPPTAANAHVDDDPSFGMVDEAIVDAAVSDAERDVDNDDQAVQYGVDIDI